VLRDLDIFKKAEALDVGMSITTMNDEIRKKFEPNAPSIQNRIDAIAALHGKGIRTYVMIAPILPEAEKLGIDCRSAY
jgi:DNA repair photolyase